MAKKQQFRVLNGLNYPDPRHRGREKRAEVGDVVSDLPEASLPWLLEQGHVEKVSEEATNS